MAVTYGGAGTASYSTGNPTPGYPAGIAAGDLLLLFVGNKPSTATSNGGGWTALASATGTGGTGTTGVDTGPMLVEVFYKIATGSESGTLTVTNSTNNVSGAQILRFSKSAGGDWDLAGALINDTTSGTSFTGSATLSGNVVPGDFMVACGIIPTDVTTPSQFSSESFTVSGVTFAGSTEIGELDTSSGNDMGGVLWYDSVSSGGASGTPSVTASATAGGTTTNVYGPIAVVRVREAPIPTSTLFGWWTAEDITGLSDGDDITSWPEHNSGYGLSWGGNKPSYESSSINSLPGAKFTRSTGETITTGSVPLMDGVTGGTLFVVLRQDSTPSSGFYYTPISIDRNAVQSTRLTIYQYGTTQLEMGARRLDSDSYSSARGTGTLGYPDPILMVVEMDWSAGTGSLHTTADGDVLLDASLTSTGSTSSTNSTGLWLGSDANSAYFDGAIAEVIVYESVLSASDRATVEDYLNAKYGLAATTHDVSATVTTTPAATATAVVTNSVTASIATAPSATGTVAVETGATSVTGSVSTAPSATATAVVTNTVTATVTVAPSGTATAVVTNTVTASVTVAPTATGTVDAITTATVTASVTTTATATATAIIVHAVTGSVTVGVTVTTTEQHLQRVFAFYAVTEQARVPLYTFNKRLVGVTVWRSGGQWYERRHISQIEYDAADVVYLGGRRHVVSEAEKTALEAAGYTVESELVEA